VKRACDLVGSRAALAERLGYSEGMIRAWLDGKVAPPPAVFFRIVDILQEAEPGYLQMTDAQAGDPAGQSRRHR
jgi:hypothetical protein